SNFSTGGSSYAYILDVNRYSTGMGFIRTKQEHVPLPACCASIWILRSRLKMSESITSQVCSVTAIITAYTRIQQTLLTLQKILDCKPGPDEIIVHVDANQKHCAAALQQSYRGLKVILSQDHAGPGGGRNKLIAAAKNELVASFDDDSYPIDTDYFARVIFLFEKYPAASLLSA